jgi:hypothetical protein
MHTSEWPPKSDDQKRLEELTDQVKILDEIVMTLSLRVSELESSSVDWDWQVGSNTS